MQIVELQTDYKHRQRPWTGNWTGLEMFFFLDFLLYLAEPSSIIGLSMRVGNGQTDATKLEFHQRLWAYASRKYYFCYLN